MSGLFRLAAFLATFVALCALDNCSNRDDSDAPHARSGLVPRVDAKTGCEYLTTPLGLGITPRLKPDGKQVCAR